MALAIKRRKSRRLMVGTVPVGGNAPISVQSMTTTPTDNIMSTVRQIRSLQKLGCEIIRVAVPVRKAAEAVGAIKKRIDIPLVADIHFDHRLALEAIRQGVDAVRINPGNMRKTEHVKAVVLAAKEAGIPIRIGVNSGSIRQRGKKSQAEPESLVDLMVDRTLEYCEQFESWGFRDIKLSVKASNVLQTIDAYRSIASKCDYPLHVGVTAAGAKGSGTVKSAIGIGSLLAEGIGDTIRVSLTGSPREEIVVGYEILEALGLRRRRPEIISCPTCGRCEIDLPALVRDVERRIGARNPDLKVAIMGCVVNGPGEAKEADIGVAGGKGFGYLFRRGRKLRRVSADRLAEELLVEI